MRKLVKVWLASSLLFALFLASSYARNQDVIYQYPDTGHTLAAIPIGTLEAHDQDQNQDHARKVASEPGRWYNENWKKENPAKEWSLRENHVRPLR